jgi:hypothetical protein
MEAALMQPDGHFMKVAALKMCNIIIIIIWFVRLLALRPLQAYCASLE